MVWLYSGGDGNLDIPLDPSADAYYYRDFTVAAPRGAHVERVVVQAGAVAYQRWWGLDDDEPGRPLAWRLQVGLSQGSTDAHPNGMATTIYEEVGPMALAMSTWWRAGAQSYMPGGESDQPLYLHKPTLHQLCYYSGMSAPANLRRSDGSLGFNQPPLVYTARLSLMGSALAYVPPESLSGAFIDRYRLRWTPLHTLKILCQLPDQV